MSQTIQDGIAHHQAGRLADAEQVYRALLARNPKDADALHLLGTLLGQRGQLDDGIQLIQRAAAARPGYVEALRNLGTLLAQTGRHDEAVAAYRKALLQAPGRIDLQYDLVKVLLHAEKFKEAAIELRAISARQPNLAEVHRDLSVCLRKQDQGEAALDESTRAVQLRPDWAEARFEHGVNLVAAGRLEQALAEFQAAIHLKPDFEQAHDKFSRVLADLGRVDQAIAIYTQLVKANPASALGHFNLGQAYYKVDRLSEAAEEYRRAALINPNHVESLANLAVTLARLQRFDDALQWQAKAAAAAPKSSIPLEAMGEILMHKLDARGAIEYFKKALEIAPDDVELLTQLGIAMRSAGQIDEASAVFRKALEKRPELVETYGSLISTGRGVVGTEEMQRIAAALDKPNLNMEDRISLTFSLGKAYDEANLFDDAFARYAAANRLVREQRASAGEKFNAERLHDSVNEMIRVFTADYFAHRKDWGSDSDALVFVVGMPRSGTTLVHQILASHPQVFGGGERGDIDRISRSLIANDPQASPLTWRREQINQAAGRHMEMVRKLTQKPRFVDKLPLNVQHLGLIATLFPGARVIFCRRSPRDTCLSCYFQNFSTGNLFAFDLADCARQQVEVYRLMDHWMKVLPQKMLEVQYETVVGDLDTQARRMIDFLGLEWHPACLEFHKAEAAVMTASSWQVRQPIYSHSVGRWKNYQKYLGELNQVLNAAGLSEH